MYAARSLFLVTVQSGDRRGFNDMVQLIQKGVETPFESRAEGSRASARAREGLAQLVTFEPNERTGPGDRLSTTLSTTDGKILSMQMSMINDIDETVGHR